MKLFKNVGIEDLENILNKGILPISMTGNDNWSEGKRSNNSREVVYLFSPKKFNSFPKYGFVLLEVEVENAKLNQIEKFDRNKDNYDEYIIDEVAPKNIKKIYIPKIFKDRIKNFVSEETFNKISFVEIEADYFKETKENEYDLVAATSEILKHFGKNANLISHEFNYFRCYYSNEILDLYNVNYVI